MEWVWVLGETSLNCKELTAIAGRSQRSRTEENNEPWMPTCCSVGGLTSQNHCATQIPLSNLANKQELKQSTSEYSMQLLGNITAAWLLIVPLYRVEWQAKKELEEWFSHKGWQLVCHRPWSSSFSSSPVSELDMSDTDHTRLELRLIMRQGPKFQRTHSLMVTNQNLQTMDFKTADESNKNLLKCRNLGQNKKEANFNQET